MLHAGRPYLAHSLDREQRTAPRLGPEPGPSVSAQLSQRP